MLRSRFTTSLGLFVFFTLGLIALHFPLLRLPYFWDEAGYYVPAAYDLLTTGDLIPRSTLLTAHPPLLSIYLALGWKLLGYTPLITRLAMLVVAAFGLLQVFRFSELLANRRVAIATALLSAIYPVIFAKSSLAHADLLATALSLWGLRLWFEPDRKTWEVATIFVLAVLAKEIAIITPLSLFAWELWTWWRSHSHRRFRAIFRPAATLLSPLAALALWYAYQHARTGAPLGETSFVSYNLSETLHPLRFFLALLQRTWQVVGHMNLWVLTAMMAAALFLPPLADSGKFRERIAIPAQLAMLAIILGHLIVHSLIGGAVLARYMMPCIPLVILISVSTLHRRVRRWPLLIAFCAVAFVAGWFINPPYRSAPEDNLAYADFVRLHQAAAQQIESRHRGTRVLTAWPAIDELSRPELGYVASSVPVVRIENFTAEQVLLARQSTAYDRALLFSTKLEPTRPRFRLAFWERLHVRFFGYHHDLAPETAAEMLGGKIVWEQRKGTQWIAIVHIDRAYNADARSSIAAD